MGDLRPAVVLGDLSTEQVAALHQTCSAAGIPVDRWHVVPAVRGWVLLSAAYPRAMRHVRVEGASLRDAAESVAASYGLNGDTVLSMLKAPRTHLKRAAASMAVLP